MPKLLIEGLPHALTEQRITIGRGPENMIRLEDASVSGRHALLQLIGTAYFINDLGSTNGTYINGLPTSNARLRVGDSIRFGKVEARFETDAPSGTQPLPEQEQFEARPAESSTRPLDFENASPFRARRSEKDQTRTALFVIAAVAFAIFLAAMIAVLAMHAPAP